MGRILRRFAVLGAGVLTGMALLTGIAGADSPGFTTISTQFASPLFGLAGAPDNQLTVADAGAGITRLRLSNGTTSVITPLSGVTDTALSGNIMYATTSGVFGSSGWKLWRVSSNGGPPTFLANLLEFEEKNDPAGDGVDSDPFDLALKGSNVIVADAAANDVLVWDGKTDWIAMIPQHNIPTAPIKKVVGCPNGPADICGLPERFDADPVPTSAAIGPDGALYVGELTGFPASPGQSRIWRIDPGARHVVCGQSPKCVLVKDGLTSIIDIIFNPEGKAYVLELDENSWLAAENGIGVGGTVNVCTLPSWTCTVRNEHLPFPTALAIKEGKLYSTLFSVVPGQAQVALLP